MKQGCYAVILTDDSYVAFNHVDEHMIQVHTTRNIYEAEFWTEDAIDIAIERLTKGGTDYYGYDFFTHEKIKGKIKVKIQVEEDDFLKKGELSMSNVNIIYENKRVRNINKLKLPAYVTVPQYSNKLHMLISFWGGNKVGLVSVEDGKFITQCNSVRDFFEVYSNSEIVDIEIRVK